MIEKRREEKSREEKRREGRQENWLASFTEGTVGSMNQRSVTLRYLDPILKLFSLIGPICRYSVGPLSQPPILERTVVKNWCTRYREGMIRRLMREQKWVSMAEIGRSLERDNDKQWEKYKNKMVPGRKIEIWLWMWFLDPGSV